MVCIADTRSNIFHLVNGVSCVTTGLISSRVTQQDDATYKQARGGQQSSQVLLGGFKYLVAVAPYRRSQLHRTNMFVC